MRNMKKALAAVAAVATLASLAACGGSDGGNDAKANAGDADKADLVFWGWDTGNTMKALIADFEKANPGITVKIQQHRHRIRHPDRTEQRRRGRQGCPRRGHAGRPDRHPVRGYRRPR